MTLADFVYSRIGECVGRDNAIKRRELLDYLWHMGAIEKITESEDREVRLIIDENPLICSTTDGYFIAKTQEDYNRAVASIVTRIRSFNDKIKRKEGAYPQFSKPGQLGLFS